MFKSVAQTAVVSTLAVVLAAAVLVLATGGTTWQAIAWAAALAVATRAIPVLATFPVAYWPRPDDRVPALSSGALARTVVRELWATMKLFFFYHPFESVVAHHEPARIVPGDTPVLLVHGFFSNAGFWQRIRPAIQAAGWANVFSMNLEPPFIDIDDYARQLHERVEDICRRCGSDSVIIVAHSMGGLAARACLANYPGGRIRRIVCLGTPNHGTLWASLLPWINTRQMRIGSAWLARLNTDRSGELITNILSEHDNIVVPQTSAAMSNTANVRVQGVGHLDMAFAREVRCAIKDALDGTRPWRLDKSQ